MTTFEIYWDDLTLQAKKRLKPLYHENIEMTPIAIVDIEEENEEENYFLNAENENI